MELSTFPYYTMKDQQESMSDPPDLWDARIWSSTELDLFLRKIYLYYDRKGFACLALTHLVNCLTIAFIIFALLVLGAFIDYSTLFTTMNLNLAFHWSLSRVHPALWVVLGVFTFFLLWQVLASLREVWEMIMISFVYSRELKIPDADLPFLEWSQICDRLAKIEDCRGIQTELSNPLFIALRILRKENYLTAIFNRDLLKLNFPGTKMIFYTKVLEWTLEYAMWSFIFDENLQVREEIVKANQFDRFILVANLRKRLIIFGFIGLLLSPFIFLYLVIYTLFRYGEEVRTHPSFLGTRSWTRHALWKFREFNELPHIFRTRINKGSKAAQEYLSQFISPLFGIIGKLFLFISSSLIGFLLILGYINSPLLLNGTFFGQTLLWYVGVLGVIFAVSKSLLVEEGFRPNPEKHLQKVIEETHHYPDEWKGQASSPKTVNEFKMLYDLNVYIFFRELLSVLLVPFILMWSLPNNLDDLLQFFQEHTQGFGDLGYICDLANFREPPEDSTRFNKLAQSIRAFQSTYFQDSIIEVP